MGSKILNFKVKFNGVLIASYQNQAHLQKANILILSLLLYFWPVMDITAHDIPISKIYDSKFS